MEDRDTVRQQQIALAEKLQLKWLQRMDALFDSGEITSTDMATLARLLKDNGWSLDPSMVPQRLRDKLTKNVAFDDDIDGESTMRLVG